MTKICTWCKKEKPLTEFHRNSGKKDGLFNNCKQCQKVRSAENWVKNKERYSLGHRKWREIPGKKDIIRDQRLQRQYGITQEQYQILTEAQNSKCAICKVETPKNHHGSGNWYIDHDHDTGRVRGLLCRDCNTALGLFKDNCAIMRSALNYIDNPPAHVAL